VSLLVALLLPAIQAARESARVGACGNNLKQIALAALNHEQQLGHFPYGGWGHKWVGMPRRGVREKQPGGWIYNLLPFLEQAALHDLDSASGADAHSRRLQTPLSVFTCPTRRNCAAWPIAPQFAYMRQPRPAGNVERVARGDYAINGGATLNMSNEGPIAIEAGDTGSYDWPDLRPPLSNPRFTFSGVSHIRIGVRASAVEDGLSNTYLIGEKYIDPTKYDNGESLGDNESLYSGYCSDNHRFTNIESPPLTPAMDGTLSYDPRNDYKFGSAHTAGVLMACGDGGVRLVEFDVDAEVHYRMGHTSDAGRPAL
jgi:hypothetical protein